MSYLDAWCLLSLLGCAVWFCLARFTDEGDEMMNRSYTRRPMRVRIGAQIEAAYLAWRIKHAERDVKHLEADRRAAVESIDRIGYRIENYEAHIDRLTMKLARALWK